MDRSRSVETRRLRAAGALGDTGSARSEDADPAAEFRPDLARDLQIDDEPRDSLFGNVTAARAGLLDVLLVAAGIVLVAWWDLIDPRSPDLALGLGAIALGLAIPARDALHGLDRRWARIRGTAAPEGGPDVD